MHREHRERGLLRPLVLPALLLGSLALGAVACASGGERADRADRDVLTQDEIQAEGDRIRTALEAVEQLRPQFLRTRPAGTIMGRQADPVRVYVDGVHWGDPRSLAQLRVEEVIEIRYVRPTDAQTRFGLDHSSGAIEVRTARRE
jgi:hypothetical protein